MNALTLGSFNNYHMKTLKFQRLFLFIAILSIGHRIGLSQNSQKDFNPIQICQNIEFKLNEAKIEGFFNSYDKLDQRLSLGFTITNHSKNQVFVRLSGGEIVSKNRNLGLLVTRGIEGPLLPGQSFECFLVSRYSQEQTNISDKVDRIVIRSEGINCSLNFSSIPVPYVKPQRDNPFVKLGNEFLNNGNYYKAIEEYSNAIKFDRNDPTNYVRRGYCYARIMMMFKERNLSDSSSQNLKMAKKDFQEAIDINSTYRDAYYYYGYAEFNSNPSMNNSRHYFKRAIYLDPNFDRSYFYYALIGYDPEINFRKCISLSRDSILISGCYLRIGVMKKENKLYSEAIDEFNQAILFDSKTYDTYFQRGLVKSIIKDYQGSIDDFSIIISNYPKNSFAYLERGKAYMLKTGNVSEACKDFIKAVELGNTSDEAKKYSQLCTQTK